MPPTTVPPVLPVPELTTNKPSPPSGTPTISQGSTSTAHAYTPACARSQLQTICLDDPFYPTDLVKEAVLQESEHFTKLYAEVAFQSADNLCDGLSRTDEEKYCNVFSQIHPISASNSWTVNHLNAPLNPTVASATTVDKGWQLPLPASAAEDLRMRAEASGNPAALQDPVLNSKGYVCHSVIHYARIMRAKNHRGQWRVIVNIPGHTQTSRIEECTKPLERCHYISPKLNSACIQKWNFQRLLAWDKYNGFEMDIFRLPVACSCFIRPKTASPLLQSQKFPAVTNNMAPPFVPPMSMSPPKPMPVHAPSNPVSTSIKISSGTSSNRNFNTPPDAPHNIPQQVQQKMQAQPANSWKEERPKNVLLQQGSPSLSETDHWLAMQSSLHPKQRGLSGQGNAGPIDTNAVQLYHQYLANMYPYQLQNNRQSFPSNLQMHDRKRHQRDPSGRYD
ncbi:hypothetical protein RvY_08576-2 [Ramazzottius varieornatus]|nr:hypothetical protein RvY_08576-2 [Ramazzottius varieornatus]